MFSSYSHGPAWWASECWSSPTARRPDGASGTRPGRDRIGPGIFVAVRHLMDGARNGEISAWRYWVMVRLWLWPQKMASATENAPPTPADGGHFRRHRIHLRIAQRQRRVVHKDRCRLSPPSNSWASSQPMVSSVSSLLTCRHDWSR